MTLSSLKADEEAPDSKPPPCLQESDGQLIETHWPNMHVMRRLTSIRRQEDL
jgi:hypothetical protein